MQIEVFEAFTDAGISPEKAKMLAQAIDDYIDYLIKQKINQNNTVTTIIERSEHD